MKTHVVRSALVGILMLGLAIPGVASAGWFNWGCWYQGTWFGVTAEDNPALSGWMVTVEGRSYWYGTNNLEWMRTGHNTFVYTTTGFALDADRMPVYVSKMYGTVTVSEDCSSDVITSTIEIFPVGMDGVIPNPFGVTSPIKLDFPETHAYRAFIDMP